MATGKRSVRPLKREDVVESAVFSPDGWTALTGSWDATVQRWDVATGKVVGAPFRQPFSAIRIVTYSPDGRAILTGSDHGEVRLWDIATGKLRYPPLRHPDGVRWVAFSPDGRLILTAPYNAPPHLWEAATGKPLGPPLPHHSRSTVWYANQVIAISADSRHALTASDDGTARLWQLSAPLQDDAERRALWTQVLTGLEMDETGATRVMEAFTWQQCQQPLQKLGETPVP